MNMMSFLAALSLGTSVISASLPVDEPTAIKLAPQIKALLDDLLRQAGPDTNGAGPVARPTVAPAPPMDPMEKALPELITQIQKLMNHLLEDANIELDEDAKGPAPAAAPTTSAAPRQAGQSRLGPWSTALTTGTLRTPTLRGAQLTPSGPLGGRGLKGGAPRLSAAEWRQIFPAK
jgi:hypothetical protein